MDTGTSSPGRAHATDSRCCTSRPVSRTCSAPLGRRVHQNIVSGSRPQSTSVEMSAWRLATARSPCDCRQDRGRWSCRWSGRGRRRSRRHCQRAFPPCAVRRKARTPNRLPLRTAHVATAHRSGTPRTRPRRRPPCLPSAHEVGFGCRASTTASSRRPPRGDLSGITALSLLISGSVEPNPPREGEQDRSLTTHDRRRSSACAPTVGPGRRPRLPCRPGKSVIAGVGGSTPQPWMERCADGRALTHGYR